MLTIIGGIKCLITPGLKIVVLKREKPGQCIVFYSRSVVTDVTVLAAADRLIAVKLDVRQLTSDLVGKFMAHEGTRANDLRYTTYYITRYVYTAIYIYGI